jgi:hypothetical protein
MLAQEYLQTWGGLMAFWNGSSSKKFEKLDPGIYERFIEVNISVQGRTVVIDARQAHRGTFIRGSESEAWNVWCTLSPRTSPVFRALRLEPKVKSDQERVWEYGSEGPREAGDVLRADVNNIINKLMNRPDFLDGLSIRAGHTLCARLEERMSVRPLAGQR